MTSLNEIFFNSAKAEGMTYEDILADVQQYCTTNLPTPSLEKGARRRRKHFFRNSSCSMS